MVPLVLLMVCVGAVTSILPFLFPDAVIALFGVILNHWLGELLAALFGSHPALFAPTPDGLSLSLQGILLVYVPLIVVLAYLQRGR
jgi:hypothetical protein